jgi:hypothetical protein
VSLRPTPAARTGNRTVTTTSRDARFEGDSSREALRVQYAALRRMTVAERLACMDDLTRLARSMSWEGLRRRNPTLTEAELEVRFFELVLGPRLAAEVLEHRRARLERPAP